MGKYKLSDLLFSRRFVCWIQLLPNSVPTVRCIPINTNNINVNIMHYQFEKLTDVLSLWFPFKQRFLTTDDSCLIFIWKFARFRCLPAWIWWAISSQGLSNITPISCFFLQLSLLFIYSLYCLCEADKARSFDGLSTLQDALATNHLSWLILHQHHA